MLSATKTVELNGDIDEETAIELALAASESIIWNSDENFLPPEWLSSLGLDRAPPTPSTPPRVPGHVSSAAPINIYNSSAQTLARDLPSLSDEDDDFRRALELSLNISGSADAPETVQRAATVIAHPPAQDETLFRRILERMPKGKFRCIVPVDNTITGHVVGKNFAVAKVLITQAGGSGSIRYLKRGLSRLVDSFDESKTLMIIEAEDPETVEVLRSKIEGRIAGILASGVIPNKSPSPVRKLAAGRPQASPAPPAPAPSATAPAAAATISDAPRSLSPPVSSPALAIAGPSAFPAQSTFSVPHPTAESPPAAALSAAINSAIRFIEADIPATCPRTFVRVKQDISGEFLGENCVDANEICRDAGANCRMRFLTAADSHLVGSLGSISLLLIEADSSEAVIDARMRAEARIGAILRGRKAADVKEADCSNISGLLSDGKTSHDPAKAEEAVSIAQDSTSMLLQRISSNLPSSARPRTIIAVPRGVGCLLVGKAYCKTNEICKALGGDCKITFLSKEKHPLVASLDTSVSVLYIEADTIDHLEEASNQVFERMSGLMLTSSDVLVKSPIPKTKPRLMVPLGTPLSRERTRHIVVDNSNVFIAAQNRGREGLGPDNLVRLNAEALSRLLSGPTRLPGLRAVAGSKPPSTNDIWQRWEAAGFSVKVACRDVSTNKESMVDEFLHAQAYAAVAHHIGDIPGEHTLVLCTGDGNANGGFSNFVHVAQLAAYNGWRVEVWSWRHSLSSRFRKLADELPDRVQICLLDDFEARLIFRAKARILPPAPVTQEATSTAAATLSPSVVEEPESSAAPAFDDDDNMCIICMEEPRSRIILPCRHFTHCATCVTLLDMECHLCRGRIEAIEIAS